MVPPVTALLVGLAPAVALTYSKSIVTNVILARAAMPRRLTLVCVLRVEEVRVRARQGATEGAAAWSVERGPRRGGPRARGVGRGYFDEFRCRFGRERKAERGLVTK